MYLGFHVRYSLFFSDFNETWRFSTNFRKILILHFLKNMLSRSQMFPADRHRQPDMAKLIVAFHNSANRLTILEGHLPPLPPLPPPRPSYAFDWSCVKGTVHRAEHRISIALCTFWQSVLHKLYHTRCQYLCRREFSNYYSTVYHFSRAATPLNFSLHSKESTLAYQVFRSGTADCSSTVISRLLMGSLAASGRNMEWL